MRRAWPKYLLVAALATFPWLNGLDVDELAWEGDYLVGDNPLLDAPDVWLQAFSNPWASGVGHVLGAAKNRGYYRPIATLDLALERRIWGKDPKGWRAGALLLHGGQAAALLGVLELALPGPAGVVLAIAWAWHPLHSEVIGSVGYRTTALTALLGLLALCLLARPGRRSLVRLGSGLAIAALALFAKETATTFVVVLPLGILALGRGPEDRRAAGLVAVVLAILAGGYWLLRGAVVGSTPGAVLGYLDFGERMILMTKAIALHARIVLWPDVLNPHYDISLFYPPLVDARTWIGIAIAAGILALTAVGLVRRRGWSFALLAAIFLLGPVAGIVPLRVLAADRFLVLPLALALLAAVVAWRDRGRPWPRAAPRRTALLLAAALALGSLGARSWTIMDDWRDLRGLLEARVRDFPESVDAQFGLAACCFWDARDLDCARHHVDAALEIYPNYPGAVHLSAEIDRAEESP